MSKNQNVGFETDVYEEKIEELKRSYLQASILTGYYFYLPMLIGEEWIITQIIDYSAPITAPIRFKENINSLQ